MFEENNDLVTDVTENVEELATEELVDGAVEGTTETEETVVTEESVKTYTDAEVDEIIKNRLGRQERSLTKKFEKQLSAYKEAESVLNAGLGTSSITEATEQMRDFYTKKGVEIPKYESSYSEYDMKAGAEREAQEIIEAGIEDVIEEVDRLADIGVDNMTPREKLVFNKLASYRKAEQDKEELASIGVSEKALQEQDFIDFAKDLNPNMSVKDKYEKYLKYRPTPKVETAGSMRSTTTQETGVKDFYTHEEAMKFTTKDFENNPELYKAVERSSYKWK